jgi:phosphoribosyl-ATP pyrophosphohydrolase
MSRFAETVDRLSEVIASRAGGDLAASWSARLIADPPLAAKKLGEEAIELALAAVQLDRTAIVGESADVIYHFLALLAATGVSLDEVAEELARRENRSGVAEKASRPG